MNALLLALLAGATWQLTLGSAAVAGVLIGTATALKAFPALLILYLAARRYWTAAIAATVSAFVLSVVDAARGVRRRRLLAARARLLASRQQRVAGAREQPVAHRGDRSDDARLQRNRLRCGRRSRRRRRAPAMLLFAGLAVLLAAALIVILVTTTRRQTAIPCELAAVTVLAILLSPIAWDHYWTLMFPAFLILYDSRDERLLGRTGADSVLVRGDSHDWSIAVDARKERLQYGARTVGVHDRRAHHLWRADCDVCRRQREAAPKAPLSRASARTSDSE